MGRPTAAVLFAMVAACGSESPSQLDGSLDAAGDGAGDAALDDAPPASTWSGPQGLVDDLGRLAIGNQVHLVGHRNGQLVHRRSADGVTWTSPTVIAPAAGNFPAMYGGFYAVGDTLYLVTADADMASSAGDGGRLLQFRRSEDSGDTWTDPVAVNSSASLIFRGRIAASQDYVHFVGVSGPTAGGGASLWYFRSTNRGDGWSATPLATGLGTYGGGQTVAVDGATVHIGYTDANGSVGAGPTLYLRSTDHGANWSTPVPIGEDTASSNRQARVQLTAADGHVFACWQREASTLGGTLPADRIGYNTSSDGGVTWGTARVLPEDTGVDRNHQHIWMAPGGGVHVLWRHGDSGDSTDDPAGYKESRDYGETWLPRVIAVDTTGTLGGSNHPWAIVADRTSVHALTGPTPMQYVHRAVP